MTSFSHYSDLTLYYYDGNYAPALQLNVCSVHALNKIKQMFKCLRQGEIKKASLVNQLGVTSINKLIDVMLISSDKSQKFFQKNLELVSHVNSLFLFKWILDRDGWETVIELIEPLIEKDSPAHQYLTEEGIDDALFTISYLEEKGWVG